MLQPTCLRRLKLIAICAAISLSSLELTFAQQGKNQFGAGQSNRRTVSPFLSMVNDGNGGGGDNGLNFFNIVRPIQRARAANRSLQDELRNVESTINKPQRPSGQNGDSLGSIPITTGRMPPTGHTPTFGDLGGRFGGSSGGGGGGVNNFGRGGRN